MTELFETEPPRPEWLSLLHNRPYQIREGENMMTGDRIVELKTTSLKAGMVIAHHVEPPEYEVIIDRLTGILKRKIVTTYGLEAEVRHELLRKLAFAAAHDRDRRVIVPFLMSVGLEP